MCPAGTVPVSSCWSIVAFEAGVSNGSEQDPSILSPEIKEKELTCCAVGIARKPGRREMLVARLERRAAAVLAMGRDGID
jgi:hypothetical protein